MGAFLHGDEHDVRHADDAAEQRKESDYPKGHADDADAGVHLHALCVAVPYPDAALVVGCCLMIGIQACAVFALKLLVGLLSGQAVKRKLYITHFVALVEHRAQRGVGRKGIASRVLRFLIDAHHAEGETAHLDILSDKALDIVGQFGCRLVAQDEHLALLVQVNFVDEAAVEHLCLVDAIVIGIDARQRGVDVLLTAADGLGVLVLCGSRFIDIGAELTFGCLQVAFLQADVTPLFQPLVGLAGLASEDFHRVAQKASALPQLRIDQSVARSEQHDEHEDAPGHGESRQACAQLVAARRLPYLIQ